MKAVHECSVAIRPPSSPGQLLVSAAYYVQAVEPLCYVRDQWDRAFSSSYLFDVVRCEKGQQLETDSLLQKSSAFKGSPGYQFWALSVCSGFGNIWSLLQCSWLLDKSDSILLSTSAVPGRELLPGKLVCMA